MSLIIGLGNNGSGVGSMKQVIVDELPDVGKSGIVYLVPKDDPELEDAYDEYIWIKQTSSWEKIGTTHIDLTNYVSVEQQSFTEVQKSLARLNIGAASNSDIPELPEEIVLQEDAGETAYGTDYDPYISSVGVVLLNFTNSLKLQARDNIEAYSKPPSGIQKTDLASDVQTSLGKADTALQEHQSLEEYAKKEDLENGNLIPALAYSLEAWADQKAIATPDTYTDAVRTTGGDIPIETSAGSKLESIKPVVGSKWTAKMLFNGSYNMLNAAKWGAANSQPYVGGVGNDFVYFLVPELTLGTFGTADENNGLLFTDEDGVNVQPASVYFKPLGATVPQSLTDGTSITPTNVSYDGKTYKDYATSGAGWLIVPKTIYDNDVCAHIAWEDWYDKYVSLNEPTTNPEAVVGTLILEGFLALAHSDKYLRGVNDEVCDNVAFGDTSATITHMVDELSVAANSWTNAATGESDSQGNALYRHSATVSAIKQGGAACIEGGVQLTVNGTTVSYVDTNATAGASVVFYEVASTSVTKAYTDSIFDGSNIDTDTGILPINDCSIEAQVGMDGEANITVKYAKNIVDQVAINATVDVPQIKRQVEEHEERITELEDTAVRTGSYDASVAVGLADNFKGDTIVDAEFYKRKTGGTQSVGSGIAAIKEVRGKSIVWNQQAKTSVSGVAVYRMPFDIDNSEGSRVIFAYVSNSNNDNDIILEGLFIQGCKYYIKNDIEFTSEDTFDAFYDSDVQGLGVSLNRGSRIGTAAMNGTGSGLRVAGLPAGKHISGYITVKVHNLTLMFGAGNEPATVEEFDKMFTLDYYDYNAGTIIPFAGQNLVTTGFNQWNEEWELGLINISNGENSPSTTQIRAKNYCHCLPNVDYYGVMTSISPKNGYIIWYDENFNHCGYDGYAGHYAIGDGGQILHSPSNAAYFRLYCNAEYGTTYNNDICINISDPDRNGTYEPYEKHTLPLDPSQWRDKNGNLVYPYGGMHGVGTAYDYAKVDADGYIRKATRCFGQVDLGSLAWRYSRIGQNGFDSNISNIQYANSRTPCALVCSKYVRIGYNSANVNGIGQGISMANIVVWDSSYNNAATFKAAMNGVILVYELATPVEVELATPIYAKYLVDKDGTEEITPANGSTPYTAPANLSILYAMDARGEIKNLPKNYLSKESTENVLNAMVTAGIIASYTMTYDAASGRYTFVITKPA